MLRQVMGGARMKEELPLVGRVVLIGFLGAGKSVVGRALALRLEWEFVDFDAEIRAREGKPLSQVARDSGPDYLRQAEKGLTEEVAQRTRLVIAPGGAWITRPEQLPSLGAATLAVWLRVSPSEAYERIARESDDHPWAGHPAPLDRIGDLMREREPLYRLADIAVPTNWRSPEAIAFEIEQIVRTRGCTRTDDEVANAA
jgi:shikimate kinase